MTVQTLYNLLQKEIPSSLSCSWDNDGFMCCANPQKEVRRILIPLDITADAVSYAIQGKYDAIISHHPLIFHGLRSICEQDPFAKKIIALLRADIAAISFHTRLDAVEGGVNDVLAALLGLQQITPFGENGIGRIGTLPTPMNAKEFACLVKEKLQAPYVNLADAKRPVSRVAVLGGNGSDDAEAARAEGADTYVSGELKYHQLCNSAEETMNFIEAGHFYTEYPVCQELKRRLLSLDPTLTCDLYNSNTIQTI